MQSCLRGWQVSDVVSGVGSAGVLQELVLRCEALSLAVSQLRRESQAVASSVAQGSQQSIPAGVLQQSSHARSAGRGPQSTFCPSGSQRRARSAYMTLLSRKLLPQRLQEQWQPLACAPPGFCPLPHCSACAQHIVQRATDIGIVLALGRPDSRLAHGPIFPGCDHNNVMPAYMTL